MFAEDFFELFRRELPPGSLPYLNQIDVGSLVGPQLASEAPGPPEFAAPIRELLLWRNLWLSPRAVCTDSHFDQFDNLFFVVNGTKDILLFPPTAFEDLLYRPSHQLFPKQARPS